MVQLTPLATALAAAVLAVPVRGHPGEEHSHSHVRREIEQREAYGAHIARSLEKCLRSPSAQMLEARAIKRRAATLARLRKRANIPQKRDETALESWETVNHNETGDYSSPYDTTSLFGSNTSCVLTPEEVVGPYYVLGELIRSDVVETQTGVPVHLDMQFIDVSTCNPVSASSLLVDLWHANATGVYSGVSATGEGGLNTDFLRGVQPTDDDGVVEFDTIFPGHYQGRATHMHITTHADATVLDNNTYSGGTVTHIGQLFFDESLRSAVEAVEPYASNTQQITSNDDDSLAPNAASTEYDPFPKFLYVGDSVSDGLVMWISVGVDPTANYTSSATPASYWTADGGVDSGESDAGGGMGGSGGAPSGASGSPPGGANMTMSGGAMPSGSGAPTGSGISAGLGVATGSGMATGSGAPAGSGAPTGSGGASIGSVAPTGSAVAGAGGAAGSVAGSSVAAGSAVAATGSAVANAGSGSGSTGSGSGSNSVAAIAGSSAASAVAASAASDVSNALASSGASSGSSSSSGSSGSSGTSSDTNSSSASSSDTSDTSSATTAAISVFTGGASSLRVASSSSGNVRPSFSSSFSSSSSSSSSSNYSSSTVDGSFVRSSFRIVTSSRSLSDVNAGAGAGAGAGTGSGTPGSGGKSAGPATATATTVAATATRRPSGTNKVPHHPHQSHSPQTHQPNPQHQTSAVFGGNHNAGH